MSARQQLAKILPIHHQGNRQADSGPDTKLELYRLKKNFSSIIRFGKELSEKYGEVREMFTHYEMTERGESIMAELEERVAGLETGIAVANSKLDNIAEHYVTKAELKDVSINLADRISMNNRWVVGTGIALAGLILATPFIA